MYLKICTFSEKVTFKSPKDLWESHSKGVLDYISLTLLFPEREIAHCAPGRENHSSVHDASSQILFLNHFSVLFPFWMGHK